MVGLLLGLYACLAPAWAGDVVVSMLDVGQGDSLLIQTPTAKTILIDAGDGKVKLAPLLAARGVDHLDLVIATHPHADHIGGMLAVLQAYSVGNYFDSGLPHTTQTWRAVADEIEGRRALDPKDPRHIAADSALKGDVFDIGDGATLTVLFPDGNPVRGTRSDLNSNSVVVRLDHGEDCFLFVGDAEEPTERRLLDQGVGQCDVLKVAHHGSEYATTPAFLAAVAPKVALISVGADNSYGHPGPKTVARLEAAGVTVYRTDLDGEITVRSTGRGEKVDTARVRVAASATTSSVVDEGKAPAQIRAAVTLPTRVSAPSVRGATAPTVEVAAVDAAAATPAAPNSPSAVTATPAADATTCPFPASAKSEVFHEDGCGNAAKVSPENYVCYPTREAAIAAGKRPAGCCKP